MNGSKPNSFYLNTHESETLVKNQQFILNAGSKVTDVAWIKGMALEFEPFSRSAISWPVIGQKMTEPILVGDCDGFCLSTTSDFYGCNAPTQPR